MKRLIFLILFLPFVVFSQQEFSGKVSDTASLKRYTIGGGAGDTASYVGTTASSWADTLTYTNPDRVIIAMDIDSVSGSPNYKAYLYHADDTVYTKADSVTLLSGHDTAFAFTDNSGYSNYIISVVPYDSVQKVSISGAVSRVMYYTEDFKYSSLPCVNWFILDVAEVTGYAKWSTILSRSYDNSVFYPVDTVTFTGGTDTIINFHDIGMWQYYRLQTIPADSSQRVSIGGKRSVYKYEGDPP